MTNTISLTRKVKIPTFDKIKENTDFKEKHYTGVIETLKWLGSGAPEDNFNGFETPVRFDMDSYIAVASDNSDEDNCGTSCCMAGAIRLFTKHKIPKNSKESYDLDKHFGADDSDELYSLFYEYNGNDPYQAFITLYNYCMTGYVDWDEEKLYGAN